MLNKFLLRIFLLCLLTGFFTPVRALISYSDNPLFLTSSVLPNLLFTLSIETPMAGAAYPGHPDTAVGYTCPGRYWESTYSKSVDTCYYPDRTYLGYFDPNKCYTYSTTTTRFDPSGATAADHSCTSKWSGNFLNWATMTAIDIFRHSLTGGDRASDTSTLTVLQRANIPAGTLGSSGWFPVKKLQAGGNPASGTNVAPSTVTTLSNATVYICNTDTGRDMRLSTTPNCGTDLGTFQVKVKVCDSAAGLETNCQTYGTSNKPIGLVQNNERKMRFGVTSYLKDNSANRDGGVVRSLIKNVGSQYHVPGLGVGTGWLTNPNKEWSTTDGTYISNPDNVTQSGVAYSGVINYINKFGENGYKSLDPVGELFYEALRYFKGLAPTVEYVAGVTSTMTDNFPVFGASSLAGTYRELETGSTITMNWKDPILAACQKNFIIGINDANPWNDKRLPGTHFNTATFTGASGTVTISTNDWQALTNPDPSINVTTLTDNVGALEGINGTWAASGSGIWTSGSASGTLDGVGGGMGTWDGSCSTAKSNVTLGRVMGTCPYTPKQNSYYIAGLAHYANITDIRASSQTTAATPPYRTKPDGTTIPVNVSTFIVDTQEYASNPLDGPKNMLWLAGKYGGFVRDPFNPADTNPNTSQAKWDADNDGIPDTYVFASRPDKMIAGLQRSFDYVESRIASASSASVNTATLRTDTKLFQAKFNSNNWYGLLYAYNLNSDGSIGTTAWEALTQLQTNDWNTGRKIITWNGTGGVAFRWASITAGQQTQIGTTDKLNWLRGDPSKEQRNGGTLRNRLDSSTGLKTILGDMIDSNPWFVGAPGAGYSTISYPGYQAFRNTYLTRSPVIYIGANDGMLHGFHANTGSELIAYAPGKLYSKLAQLTAPSYGHKYFVNGSPMIADAEVTTGNWRSVLVGGFNSGAQGFFALNVTDPSQFNESSAASLAMWEFSDSNDSDMGHSFHNPVASPLNGQAVQIGRLTNGKWAAVVGNGYNSDEADGAAGTGRSLLYLLYLDGGASGSWTAGANFIKIGTGVAGNGPDNGLATPFPLDTNGDLRLDRVYAGDLKGNVWRFDITDVAAPTVTLIYQARDASGNVQPITTAIWPIRHPNGGYMLLFGTGKYLESGDLSNTNVQTFYGIWDKNSTTITGRSSLVQQTVLGVNSTGQYRITSNNSVDWATKKGWYMDLPTTGERVAYNPLVRPGNVLVFATLIPGGNPCVPGGDGWIMELNALSGARFSTPTFDTNGDGVIDEGDLVQIAGDPSSKGGAGGVKSLVGITPTPTVLRVSRGSSGSSFEIKYAPGTTGDIQRIRERSYDTTRGRIAWREMR